MNATVAIDDRIQKCEKILSQDPGSQIFAALAEAHRRKGELDKAFRICKTGLKSHDSYGSAHLVMAKINLDRGLYDWAESEVNKASAIDGRTRAIELLLAEINIYKGEFSKATSLLTKLHQADPDNPQIKKLLELSEKIPEEQTVLTARSGTKERAAAPDRVASVPEPEEAVATVSLNESEVVSKAVGISGIDGAVFINKEGLIVESEWTLKFDQKDCAAEMAGIGSVLHQGLISSSFGMIDNFLLETSDKVFYDIFTESGFFLFVANSSTNLGAIRMKIDNIMKDYN